MPERLQNRSGFFTQFRLDTYMSQGAARIQSRVSGGEGNGCVLPALRIDECGKAAGFGGERVALSEGGAFHDRGDICAPGIASHAVYECRHTDHVLYGMPGRHILGVVVIPVDFFRQARRPGLGVPILQN